MKTNPTESKAHMASIGKFLKTSTLALASLALFACAHGNDKKGEAEHPKEAELPVAKKSAPDAGSSIEAKQVAAEEEATYVAEIKFPKTKSTLTANDKERLKKIFDQAAAKGQIEDIKSVAWADSEYPSVHTKNYRLRNVSWRITAIKRLKLTSKN